MNTLYLSSICESVHVIAASMLVVTSATLFLLAWHILDIDRRRTPGEYEKGVHAMKITVALLFLFLVLTIFVPPGYVLQ